MNDLGVNLTIDDKKYIFLLNEPSEITLRVGELLICLGDAHNKMDILLAQVKRMDSFSQAYNRDIVANSIFDYVELLKSDIDLVSLEFIKLHLANSLLEYNESCSIWLESFSSLISEDIENYVFSETPHSTFGDETVGQWLLSAMCNVIWFLGFTKHTLKNLCREENVDRIVKLFDVELIELQHIQYKIIAMDGALKSVYSLGTIASAIIFDLSNVLEHEILIKECENCKGAFVPKIRADEKYCDRISPQDVSKTCKEFGSQRLWYEKLKHDEVAKQARNIYMAKQNRAKRNPDIEEYSSAFEQYKTDSANWKKDVKAGRKTRDDYKRWLENERMKKIK